MLCYYSIMQSVDKLFYVHYVVIEDFSPVDVFELHNIWYLFRLDVAICTYKL